MIKKLRIALILVMIFSMSFGSTVLADGITEKPYLTLGNDLKPGEKETVMDLLGVSESSLDEYEVIYVTNQDEHDYLDGYLSSSVIGSRALSSLLLVKREEGYGIEVSTKNISYCTEDMYRNALSTAGLTDVDVKVAGPFSITGTAALVGAMKTYESITGEAIPEASKDAATNELVLTGEIAESIGDKESAAELFALSKQYVLENDLSTPEEIKQAVEDAAEQLDISLTDADKEKISALMVKVSKLDLDADQIKKQAKDIFDKLGKLDIDTSGFFAKMSNWFSGLIDTIKGWFK